MTKKPVVADAPILLSGAALSDPVGHYMVRGTNPNGSSYTGEVLVTRTGQTFGCSGGSAGRASSVLASQRMKPSRSRIRPVAAAGIALYSRTITGRWEGIWTLAGSRETGTDVWTPR